jgi:hypothetical protein
MADSEATYTAAVASLGARKDLSDAQRLECYGFYKQVGRGRGTR